MFRICSLLASLVALLVLLAPQPATAQFEDPVELRFVHLVPDAPPVDVYVDGDVAFQNIAFGELAAWQQVEEAEVDVAVTVAGDVLENAVFSADDISLFVNSPDLRLSIIAYGSLARDSLAATVIVENYTPTDGARLELFHGFERAPAVDLVNGETLLLDNLAFPGTRGDNDGHFTLNLPADTYSDLRLEADNTETTLFDLGSVELLPGTSTFIAAVGPIESPQLIIETTEIPAAAAPAEDSTTADDADTDTDTATDTDADTDTDAAATDDSTTDDDTTDTPATDAATDDAATDDAATDDAATDDTTTDTPSDDSATDDATATDATDTTDDTAADTAADTTTDEPTSADDPPAATGPLFVNVRVAHLVPDAPAVDIYINDVPLNTAASFTSFTPWLLLPAGPLTVDLVPAGAPLEEAVFSADDIEVGVAEDTQRITIAALGSAADDNIFVQTFIEDYSQTEPDQSRLGVFHAIPDAPAVDVLLNNQRAVANLAFPGATGSNDGHFELTVNSEVVDVNVVASDSLTPIVEVQGVELPAQSSLLLTVAASAEGDILLLQTVTRLE